jgi:hypothetical protein
MVFPGTINHAFVSSVISFTAVKLFLNATKENAITVLSHGRLNLVVILM